MATEIGRASLMEEYAKNVAECNSSGKSKDEYGKKLQWVLERAGLYAKLCNAQVDDVLKAWESKRTYWWINYYQDCNQPDPYKLGGHPVVLYKDWLERGKKLYGENMLDWKVKCPACGHVQRLRDFKDAGVDEDLAFTNCASRFGLGGRESCKWTTGGLLRIGGVYVIRPDFVPVLAFDFADEPDGKTSKISVGDAVTVHGVERFENKVGEVIEVFGDGMFVVRIASIPGGVEDVTLKRENLFVDREISERLREGGGGVVFR